MVRISRFASKYHTTPKKKTKQKLFTEDEDKMLAFITAKPKKLKKDTIPKKEVPRPQPDARAEFFGEKKPTGYMNIDVKGKVKELKALTRKERLDLARFKNKQKARRK